MSTAHGLGMTLGIMALMGHYPMLERPAKFNRLVAEMVAALMK